MTAGSGEPVTHPLRRIGAEDPPPPLREQLPLPRREQQAHLEPQLRSPGGAGHGTPFAPFAEDEPAPAAAPACGRAAEFHAGTRRGRGTAGSGSTTGG